MIRVNDRDEIEWQEGMTVARLLEVCRFTSPKIAVFVNGTNEPFMAILMDERFTPLPLSVILIAMAVVLFVVYELLTGNSPRAEGGATSMPIVRSAVMLFEDALISTTRISDLVPL